MRRCLWIVLRQTPTAGDATRLTACATESRSRDVALGRTERWLRKRRARGAHGILGSDSIAFLGARRYQRDSAVCRGADVVIVDRYGVLGDLYSLADVAYVGGGFHSAGVHSVLEPAAFGAPVLFGPRHERSREATELIQAEGGTTIKGLADLTIRLDDWLGSAPEREVAGAHARAMVQAGLGAAERSYELVMALLPGRRAPTRGRAGGR